MKIGITGGMGCGKSNLLKYLERSYENVTAIDLDKLAFEAYSLNPWLLKNIANRFGQESVERDAHNNMLSVNRPHLSKVAFKDERSLLGLKSITSPAIRSLLNHKLSFIETQSK